MPQRIDVQGVGVVEFPDGMSDADIVSAVQKNLKSSPATKPEVAAPAPIKPATPTTQQSSEGRPPRATSAGAAPVAPPAGSSPTWQDALKHALPGSMVAPFLKRFAETTAPAVKAPRQAFEAGKAGTPPTTEEMIAPAGDIALLAGFKGGPKVEGKLPSAVEKVTKAAEPKPVDVEVKPAQEPKFQLQMQPSETELGRPSKYSTDVSWVGEDGETHYTAKLERHDSHPPRYSVEWVENESRQFKNKATEFYNDLAKWAKQQGATLTHGEEQLTKGKRLAEKIKQAGMLDSQGNIVPRQEPLTGVPGATERVGELSPPEPAPPSPKETVSQHSDDLFWLRQSITADKIDVAKRLDAIPKEMQTAEVQERMYHKLENPGDVLSPQEQKVFDTVIQPIREEIQKLYAVAKGKGMEGYVDDPTYAHRVVKGKETRAIKEEGHVAETPQMGVRSLPKTTSALKERKIYALRDENGKAIKMVPATQYELGQTVGKAKVTQATTREIEAHTPIRYQKSAAVNMGDTLVRMRAAVRNIQHLERITQDPAWLEHAKRIGDNQEIPRDWKESKIPQLRGWAIEPKLRAAFDDFAGDPLIDGLDKLRTVNKMAIGSLFWNPIPHVENVAGHWVVGRGWDNFTPQGYKSLALDGARAIKAVITQDKLYESMLRHGSGQVYGGVANREFYNLMAKKFGLEIEKNPQRWGKVIKTLGLNSVADLTASIYNASSKVLWAANDMFMVQRVLELERKGLSRLAAIKEAEKHIPNYRIPPQVLNSRVVSRFLQDPLFMEFGRYRYGQFNSYANMVRDLVGKSKTPKERIDAIGNMFMLGLLAYVIYPAVSHGLQALTGDKDIKKLKRGPASAVDSAEKVLTGEKDFWHWVQSVITLSPALKEGFQQGMNYDLFTGKPITQPGAKTVEAGAQRLEHAAGTMVAPYQQGEQTAKMAQEHGLPREILKQAIGTEDRSEAAKRWAERQKQGYMSKKDRKALQRRRQQPKGLIEKIPGYLGIDE